MQRYHLRNTCRFYSSILLRPAIHTCVVTNMRRRDLWKGDLGKLPNKSREEVIIQDLNAVCFLWRGEHLKWMQHAAKLDTVISSRVGCSACISSALLLPCGLTLLPLATSESYYHKLVRTHWWVRLTLLAEHPQLANGTWK